MEYYKIIATCANYTGIGNPRTLELIPENFEGVKLSQSFSWVNPMGYTPKASLETMRIILNDKIWLDAIYDTYGLESIVSFAIYTLKDDATDHELNSTFKVDFESYTKTIDFSEFGLNADSIIDYYNKIKNTSIDVTGTLLAIPKTENFINYVSVKLSEDEGENGIDLNTFRLIVEKNEESKIYGNDSSLYEDGNTLYKFDRGASGTADIYISAVGSVQVDFSSIIVSANVFLKIYKNDFSNPVVTLGSVEIDNTNTMDIDVDFQKTKLSDFAFNDLDTFFLGVQIDDVTKQISDAYGHLQIELFVSTGSPVTGFVDSIFYLRSDNLFSAIFDNQSTLEDAALKAIGITSANAIINKSNKISLVPKDFITDYCAANGALINFKNDGTVEVKRISTFFNSLLLESNAFEVEYFQDVEINYDISLNFASVSVGMAKAQYDVYPYIHDWNKILTFNQSARNASENLDLSLKKFRCDYSGILDFITKTSKTTTESSPDLFLFYSDFEGNTTDEGVIYDVFTPRDFLDNSRVFLSFCFCNFGKDTLTISSNGGDDFNLFYNDIYQFDDFVFNPATPRILPLKIKISCLIQSTDFTTTILKIANEGYMPISVFGEFLFIFVTKAETTDNLNEQEIIGNLIYFPAD